jgi:GlpG protein
MPFTNCVFPLAYPDMRLIGHLGDEPGAKTFGDYLFVQGITNQVEFEKDHGWAIWINDEDHIERASVLLDGFRKNPADPSYAKQAKGASEKRAEEEKKNEAFRKRIIEGDKVFRPIVGYGLGPVSLVLIFISVGVFLLSKFGKDPQAVASLFMSVMPSGGLPEIRHGQIWRLITPIFIHFDILHILFNMLWLRDLGSMIEGRKGSGFFTLLVIGVALASNLAQYFFAGPIFGGMSGVVYGLLGYVWMRAKFDPASGFFLHPTIVTIMLIWLVVCYTGWLGHVANTAHTAGLLAGGLWGYLGSLRPR